MDLFEWGLLYTMYKRLNANIAASRRIVYPPTPSLNPSKSSQGVGSNAKEERGHRAFFSRNSLASLIFVARYGLPPRSGWFRIMSWRCFLRIISFDKLPSLCKFLISTLTHCLHHATSAPVAHESMQRTLPLISGRLLFCSSSSRSRLCRMLFPSR